MVREYETIFDDISKAVDLFLISFAFLINVEIYQYRNVMEGEQWKQYYLIFAVYLLFWLISSRFYHVYQSRRFITLAYEIRHLVYAHMTAFAATCGAVVALDPSLISNRFLFYFEAISLFLMLAVHIAIRMVLESWRAKGRNTRYVILLGNGPAAHHYLERIGENPQLGYRVIGYLADQKERLPVAYLGDYTKLNQVLSSHVVDVAVVTDPLSKESVKESIALLNVMGKSVRILLDDIVAQVARCKQVDFDGLPMVAYDGPHRLPEYEFVKRWFDLILSSAGLLLISPVLVVIAIAIKMTSSGPVLFKQERVGLNGRTFKMYKFRSMVVNAEELKAKLAHMNEMSGPVFKIKDDPRVTSIGRFLRKTSLDELPQLFNVLIGEMSLVGPRPPLPSEVNLYNPKHRKRLAVRPGITCIWQISGRNNIDFEQWMDMDSEYVDGWSLGLDLKILFKTVPVVLRMKGAS